MSSPQTPGAHIVNVITASIEGRRESYQRTHDPETYTICPFPGSLEDVEEGIRSPKLASFGPYHRGKEHLLRFDVHKRNLQVKFLSRTQILGRDSRFYVERLTNRIGDIKRCYSKEIVLPPDDELVEMMLLDGSFMVELFLEYDEGDVTRQWPVHTLIADLLKLENQLPFFVLQELFNSIYIGERAFLNLPNLALKFLSQAFRTPADMVMPNFEIQEPKHLLDLFRRSLIQSANPDPQEIDLHPDPQEIDLHYLMDSLKNVINLRNEGITARQKTARSLLEIDFSKFHIPPFALKIPPVAIDDFNIAILLNCVAWELCFRDKRKYFAAYVCFMSCLLKQTEDVAYLRSVGVVQGYAPDEMKFIRLVNDVGRSARNNLQECYLWKQCLEIDGYCKSNWAWIGGTLLKYNNVMLYCSLLQLAVGIISWRLSGE